MSLLSNREIPFYLCTSSQRDIYCIYTHSYNKTCATFFFTHLYIRWKDRQQETEASITPFVSLFKTNRFSPSQGSFHDSHRAVVVQKPKVLPTYFPVVLKREKKKQYTAPTKEKRANDASEKHNIIHFATPIASSSSSPSCRWCEGIPILPSSDDPILYLYATRLIIIPILLELRRKRNAMASGRERERRPAVLYIAIVADTYRSWIYSAAVKYTTLCRFSIYPHDW